MSAPNPNPEEPAAEPQEDERDASLSLKGGVGLNLGPLKGAQQYLSEVRVEFRKISWPTRRQVLNETIVVLIVVTLLTFLVTGLDWVFAQISNRFLV